MQTWPYTLKYSNTYDNHVLQGAPVNKLSCICGNASQQSCVHVYIYHGAAMITFSSGSSCITQMARCFNIFFDLLLALANWANFEVAWPYGLEMSRVAGIQNNEMHLDDSCLNNELCSACVPGVWLFFEASFCARQLRFSMTAVKKWSLCLWAFLSVISTRWFGFRC